MTDAFDGLRFGRVSGRKALAPNSKSYLLILVPSKRLCWLFLFAVVTCYASSSAERMKA